jgi:hypothetical protein
MGSTTIATRIASKISRVIRTAASSIVVRAVYKRLFGVRQLIWSAPAEVPALRDGDGALDANAVVASTL